MTPPVAEAPSRLHAPQKNRLLDKDRTIHDWYRFVLAFPPHLVREFIDRCGGIDGCFLDPFCGTGTTLVEAKLRGVDAVGVDANPVACLAARVKTNWTVSAPTLEHGLHAVLSAVSPMAASVVRDADVEQELFDHSEMAACDTGGYPGCDGPCLTDGERMLLPKGYISEKPLAKVLLLREAVHRMEHSSQKEFLLLALAATIVKEAANIAFGPEIYLSKVKNDAPVFEMFGLRVRRMIHELRTVQAGSVAARTQVCEADARDLEQTLAASRIKKIGALLTSPPYPNEKDYTRTTRLELVLLGYLKSRVDLRSLKARFLRSSTRNVFKDDQEGVLVGRFRRIQQIARTIESKRIALKKTSGFERLYHRVVTEYFGGMYRHLQHVQRILKPGAQCGYVVGDQMSYLMVPIPTGQILAELADDLGFRHVEVVTWRERWATASRRFIKEEIVYFQK